MSSTAHTDALIHRIYDAALDPTLWPGILQHVVEACGGRSGTLITPLRSPAQGGIGFSYRIPPATVELWSSYPIDEDPFARAASARGLFREGLVLDGDDLVPSHELVRTRFYRDLLQPSGIGRLCSGVVFDSTDANKLPTVISVYRHLSDAPFDLGQREWLGRLVGHLSRSLGVMFHLRDSRLRAASTAAALDLLTSGVVLLDRHGEVQSMNAAARGQLERGDPWRLESGGWRSRERLALAPRLASQEADFHHAVRGALDPLAEQDPAHFSAAMVLPDTDGTPACVMHAAPLGAMSPRAALVQDGLEAPRAIVFLYDLSAAASLRPDMLAGLFDLTPAEARAALQVLRGGTLESMARRLDVSPNTLKTQLQAVYGKTRTHRQADLLKLLLALASR